MSIDYIIHFGNTVPTMNQIIEVYTSFLGEAMENVLSETNDVITIFLKGGSSSPKCKEVTGEFESFVTVNREFKIFVFSKHITLVCKLQDEFTQSVVEGLAKVFVRFFQGELIIPS